MHLERTPEEDWLIVMALERLAADAGDDRVAARADSLAVAIAEDYGLAPEEAADALARSLHPYPES